MSKRQLFAWGMHSSVGISISYVPVPPTPPALPPSVQLCLPAVAKSLASMAVVMVHTSWEMSR